MLLRRAEEDDFELITYYAGPFALAVHVLESFSKSQERDF